MTLSKLGSEGISFLSELSDSFMQSIEDYGLDETFIDSLEENSDLEHPANLIWPHLNDVYDYFKNPDNTSSVNEANYKYIFSRASEMSSMFETEHATSIKEELFEGFSELN